MSSQQQVLQVVSGDGEFNESGVRQFVSAAHIDTAGMDYQTIAITGPQSSGKSTLMNALVRFDSLRASAVMTEFPTHSVIPEPRRSASLACPAKLG